MNQRTHPELALRAPWSAALAGVLLCMAAAPAALADQDQEAPADPVRAERTLIRSDLGAEPIVLLGFDGRRISYLDEHGIERSADRSTILGVAPAWWIPGHRPGSDVDPEGLKDLFIRGWSGVAHLTDGQRLIGRPGVSGEGPEPRPEHFIWQHPRLGAMQISLEAASRILTGLGAPPAPTPRTAAPPAPGLTHDQLLLINGDRIEGLVDSVNSAVVIQTDQAGKLEIAIDRIREIHLANPPAGSRGAFLWFDDGTVVQVDSAGGIRPIRNAGSPSIAVRAADPASSEEGVWRLEELEAVLLDASAVRPLTSLEITAQDRVDTGGVPRRVLEPARRLGRETPPFWAADVELPGPMAVTWALPEGAALAAGWVELPEENWAWGDCEVVISWQGVEQWRKRINADEPIARFHIPLSGRGGLRIAVEAGEHGPIQDQVILRRVLIGTRR